jgi:DNA-binding NarL/FixJ family response regulator
MKTLEKLPGIRLEPKVLETLEREESLNAMMFRFGPMSIKERKMVEMRLEGHSFTEIAEELGEEMKTTRLHWRNMILRQRARGWHNVKKSVSSMKTS